MPSSRPGRAEVEALVSSGRLQRVPPSAELARATIDQASAHLTLAASGTVHDPVGSFQLAYDAARKALTALLTVQGLRPTSRGGHIVVREAISLQFGDELREVVRHFEWMRRLRNHSEYPSADHPAATASEAEQAVRFATQAVESASQLVEQVGPF